MSNISELVQAMQEQARMISSYIKALQKEGMSKEEAIQIAIAYQNSQITAAALAQVERENRLFMTPLGSLPQ